MAIKVNDFTISVLANGRDALRQLDYLSGRQSRVLFVISEFGKLLGTITDGDIRRGLLFGYEIVEGVDVYMNRNFKFIYIDELTTEIVRKYKQDKIQLLPILNSNHEIIKILDLANSRSVIPVSALIMAGGKGERLRPLTQTVPKPMLSVGGKPILEHNIDRLISFGITKFFISVNYLKDVIMDYFGDGSSKGIEINYIEEKQQLGTIGALSLISNLDCEDLLVMNSDILTDIDFEDFFLFYREQNSVMAVASIPYRVDVPYAVLETTENVINSFKEKPSFTYYSNAGIYFLKSSLQQNIKKDEFLNATDLIDIQIASGKKVVHYPVLGYWLDIGKYQDFIKAQEDIKHLRF